MIEHLKDKHNGLWVLLYYDNLAAHVSNTAKSIFVADNVFFCYFPPYTTESVQPIDTNYSRLLRCIIGNLLDTWLMQESNLAE